MNCPNCLTEMKELEELIDTYLMDVQDWPTAYWCPECGVFIGIGIKMNQTHVPIQLLKRKEENGQP